MNPLAISAIKYIVGIETAEERLKAVEKLPKARDCPRCQGTEVFIIDEPRKQWWCKKCCAEFNKFTERIDPLKK
jgi:transposase-like protein